jgi:hypothetical protein
VMDRGIVWGFCAFFLIFWALSLVACIRRVRKG